MKDKIFKRKIYSKILEWKQKSNGDSALLIEGPRRVGKSTVVSEFAQKEYKTHIIIDFNKASSDVKNLFDDLEDLNYIFLQLQAKYNVILHQRDSVIVFDEVQKCPKARQAIKYLVEDGRYDYIETGSLISIKQNTKGITIPSEEDVLEMHPMDYEEFRWALGDEVSVPLLRQMWESKKPLGAAFRQSMRDFRLYMLIGGMPQAVEKYIETNNFTLVDQIKRRILKLYEDDFLKIDRTGRISKIFRSIPAQLTRNIKRYSTSAVIGKQNGETVIEFIKALEDSKTVNVCYRCDDPNVGMSLNQNDDNYKLFLADTGLFITLAFWDKDITENVIYEKFLSDKLPANLGYIFENVVEQMLISKDYKPYYYTWKRDEKHFYEIDFLIPDRHKIAPIEVKSSTNISHASLDAFKDKFSSRISREYLVCPKDYKKDGSLEIIPPVLVQFI